MEMQAVAVKSCDDLVFFFVTFSVASSHHVCQGLRNEGKNGKMRLMHSSNVCVSGVRSEVFVRKVYNSKGINKEALLSLFHAVSSQAYSQKECVFLLLSQSRVQNIN